MGKQAVWIAVSALVITSCAARATENTEPDPAPVQTTAGPKELPGRLVVLDSSGDVVVMRADGSERAEITNDAGETVFYTQPIWSPGSDRLAWGQVTDDGFSIRIESVTDSEAALLPVSGLPFYMSWSPDGALLGVLHNGANGLDLEMVDVSAGTSTVIDQGAPLYFSWSPTGDRMVTHIGESRFEILSPTGSKAPKGTTDSSYLAPQWTPNGVFHVADGNLVKEAEDGGRTILAAVEGLALFVANREGSRVALQWSTGQPDLTASLFNVPIPRTDVVVVVDISTEEVSVVGRQPAVGFFWSPDGESLLILEATTGRDGLTPRVWGVDGETIDYPRYLPAGAVARDLLPFFPQYAQSISFWAPDSSAFAFAGGVDGEQGIWVQELDEPGPELVSEGFWVAWSHTD